MLKSRLSVVLVTSVVLAVFDIVMWWKQHSHMWWIRTNIPSRDSDHDRSTDRQLLSKEQFMELLEGIQQLRSRVTKDVTHSIVIIIAHRLIKGEYDQFQAMVEELLEDHQTMASNFRTGHVIVIDDLYDFIPYIAHKMQL
jgi:hypothetical protein